MSLGRCVIDLAVCGSTRYGTLVILWAFTGVVAGIRPLREEDQHCGKP